MKPGPVETNAEDRLGVSPLLSVRAPSLPQRGAGCWGDPGEADAPLKIRSRLLWPVVRLCLPVLNALPCPGTGGETLLPSLNYPTQGPLNEQGGMNFSCVFGFQAYLGSFLSTFVRH